MIRSFRHLVTIGMVLTITASAMVSAAPISSGASKPDRVGLNKSGSLLVGLGPNVKVDTKLDDFNCVDSQQFNGFTTEGWSKTQPFKAEIFTFEHGCGTRSSWVLWDVTVGAPWNESGKVWLGQDGPGQSYYAQCLDFKKFRCQQRGSTGLIMLPKGCDEGVKGFYVIHEYETCSVGPIDSYNGGRLTGIVDGRYKIRFTVYNVGPSCPISSGSRQSELSPGEAKEVSGVIDFNPKGADLCYLAAVATR